MGDPNSELIESYFRKSFRLHSPEKKLYSCIGNTSRVAKETSVLRDRLGWIETADLAEVTSVFISIPNSEADTIDDIIATATNAEYVFLEAEYGSRTTGLLGRLELLGFRAIMGRDNITYLTNCNAVLRIIEKGVSLGNDSVADFFQESWSRVGTIPENTLVDLCLAMPNNLLVPARFDIAIKALYARLWKTGRAGIWRDFAYYHQALRITGPSWGVVEQDGSGKTGMDQFQAAFHSLLSNLNLDDIPAVPVDSELCAFDGAHRIASGIAMDRAIRIIRISDNPSNCRATADFFRGTAHGHAPCPVEILDEAAIEYCRIKSGLVLILIFPSVASEQFVIKSLSKFGEIVYRTDLTLPPQAGDALLRQVYMGHGWTKDTSEGSGFSRKVKSCFPFSGTLRAVLVDTCNHRKLRTLKEEIRAHYGLGNHSIHITDGDDEVLRVARIVFNKNSVDLLNMGIGTLPGFHEKLFLFRDWLEANGIDEEMVCIGGSAMLALLGLRECRDLDFLYDGDSTRLPPTPEKIGCHNSLEHHYSHCIGDIIGDPRLHCWYLGMKFCAPQLVCDMKRCRGEPKDHSDVIMLQSRLPRQRAAWVYTILGEFVKISGCLRARGAVSKRWIKDRLRPLANIIRSHL